MAKLVISVLLLLVTLILAAGSIWALFRQKVVYDKDNAQIDIELPILGKLKTNVPAIAIALISMLPVYYVYQLTRPDDEVAIVGTIKVPMDISDTITVGVTSPSWTTAVTPGADGKAQVNIPVPDSWRGYSVYAYVLNGAASFKPSFTGVDGTHSFELELRR